MFGLFGGGGGQGLYDAPQQPMQQTNPFTRGPVFGGGSGGFGGGFGGFGGFQQQSPYMGGQGFGGGYGGFNPFQQQMQMQNPFMGGQGFGGFGGFQQPMQQQYMPQQSFYGFGPGFGYGGQNQFDPRMQNPYGPPQQQQQPFQLPQQLQQMPQPSQAMPFSQPPQRQYADFQRQAQQGQGNSQQFGQGQMSDDAARRYMMQGKQQQLAQPQPQPSGDTFLGMPVGGGQASPQMNSLMDTIARNSMSQPTGTPQQPRGARQSNMPQRSVMSQALAQQAAMDRSTPFDLGERGYMGGFGGGMNTNSGPNTPQMSFSDRMAQLNQAMAQPMQRPASPSYFDATNANIDNFGDISWAAPGEMSFQQAITPGRISSEDIARASRAPQSAKGQQALAALQKYVADTGGSQQPAQPQFGLAGLFGGYR